MDEPWAELACDTARRETAAKEAAALHAGIGLETGPPPYFAGPPPFLHMRTLQLPGPDPEPRENDTVDIAQEPEKAEQQTTKQATMQNETPASTAEKPHECPSAKETCLAMATLVEYKEPCEKLAASINAAPEFMPASPAPEASPPSPPTQKVTMVPIPRTLREIKEGVEKHEECEEAALPRPALLDKAEVVTPAEQNSMAVKDPKTRRKKPCKVAEETEEEVPKKKSQKKPKAQAKKPKAKAKAKAKAKQAAKAKAKSKSAKDKKVAKPGKRKAAEPDDASENTKHYSPAKNKKGNKKMDEKAEYKARLSRKSSAYHKARAAALKAGQSKEQATAAGKQVSCIPIIACCFFFAFSKFYI